MMASIMKINVRYALLIAEKATLDVVPGHGGLAPLPPNLLKPSRRTVVC